MSNPKQFRIGIDVGGTKIAGVLIDEKNKVIEHITLATPRDNLDHFLIMVSATVDPLIKTIEKKKGHLLSLGIGIPGPIDYEKNEVVVAPNLKFLNRRKIVDLLREKIAELKDVKISLDNDANCFVRAEAVIGVGKGCDNLYGLTIGTGIGGAWWYEGKIYHGHHGAAGEPGHLIIDVDKQITLEDAYQKLMQSNAALIAEEAYRGDLLAEQRFSEIGSYLGTAISTIVNIIDPKMIILGGGVVGSSDLFLKTAQENMKRHIFTHQSRSVKLVKGKVGPLAGAIGAALL